MKELRIDCEPDFFPELEGFMMSKGFEEKPKLDRIEVVLGTGVRYWYKFEYQFGLWYIVTD